MRAAGHHLQNKEKKIYASQFQNSLQNNSNQSSIILA